jgi:hypothetical protein
MRYAPLGVWFEDILYLPGNVTVLESRLQVLAIKIETAGPPIVLD